MTKASSIDIFNEIYPLLFDKSRSTVGEVQFIKKLVNYSSDNNYYRNSIKFSAYLHGGINAFLNIEFSKSFIQAEYSGTVRTKYPNNFELFAENYQNLIALIEDIAQISIGEFTYDGMDYLDEKEIKIIKQEFGFTVEDTLAKTISKQIIQQIDDMVLNSILKNVKY